jgi:AcrR family transcriptional regulator
VSSSDLVSIDGRRLGRRAQLTRRRLLDATAELLATTSILDLAVVDIARKVGSSPATFYQYFRDVEEAVLALAEEVGEQLAPVDELLVRSWTGRDGLDTARHMVDEFLHYWDGHRAILRTRNLAAQEGDQRFRRVRNASLQPITEHVAAKIVDSQANGRVSDQLAPMAAASAIVSMLERMAAFHRDLEAIDVSRDDLVEATARIVYQTVTGRKA